MRMRFRSSAIFGRLSAVAVALAVGLGGAALASAAFVRSAPEQSSSTPLSGISVAAGLTSARESSQSPPPNHRLAPS